jgi:hypothetical protein
VQNERPSFKMKVVRTNGVFPHPDCAGAGLAWLHGMRSHERKFWSSGGVTQSQRPEPKPGDVLVSERTARADIYEISLVPAAAHLMVRRYDEAIRTVQELARQHGVDGWCTVDQTHYAQVARYRTRSGE